MPITHKDPQSRPPVGPDGFSWSVEHDEDGREVTLVTVPRIPPVLVALKAWRADLKLRGLSGDSLTFEVLEAA